MDYAKANRTPWGVLDDVAGLATLALAPYLALLDEGLIGADTFALVRSSRIARWSDLYRLTT